MHQSSDLSNINQDQVQEWEQDEDSLKGYDPAVGDIQIPSDILVDQSVYTENLYQEFEDESFEALDTYKLNEFQKYDPRLVQAAMNEGKTVLLDVYAGWCSTCNVNKSRLETVIQNSDNEVAAFVIDYDSSETQNVRRQLGVTFQSTYIRFDGQQETKRVVGLLNDRHLDELVN